MPRRLCSSLFYACLLLALAGALTACGEASACPPRPNSPGTSSAGGGLVSIETDHAVYAPGETPRVTIVNLTPDVLVATPRPGNGLLCPAVRLQKLVGVEWQEVNICSSAGGGDAPIANNATPLGRGRSPVWPPVPLDSPGTYRYVLSYGPLEPKPPCPCGTPPTLVYSAVLRVCTCGVCS